MDHLLELEMLGIWWSKIKVDWGKVEERDQIYTIESRVDFFFLLNFNGIKQTKNMVSNPPYKPTQENGEDYFYWNKTDGGKWVQI